MTDYERAQLRLKCLAFIFAQDPENMGAPLDTLYEQAESLMDYLTCCVYHPKQEAE